jgi:hypothetical protein
MTFAMLVFAVTFASAQAGKDGGKDPGKNDSKASSRDGVSRLRIEVTGGDANRPVSNASVYLKFSEDRKILKDRHHELDLKTNDEGVTRSPEIPMGKLLIQIVASGWKTYGEYFDINQSEQTVTIHLVRPVTPY